VSDRPSLDTCPCCAGDPRADEKSAGKAVWFVISCTSCPLVIEGPKGDAGAIGSTNAAFVAAAALWNRRPPQTRRHKASHVGAPAVFSLEMAARQLRDAFGGDVHLVGSALERADRRDVDVRQMLPEAAFAALFPRVTGHTWEFDTRWLLLTVSISAWLSQQTGLPIDFQFQPVGHGNKLHHGPRNPMGMRFVPAEGYSERLGMIPAAGTDPEDD